MYRKKLVRGPGPLSGPSNKQHGERASGPVSWPVLKPKIEIPQADSKPKKSELVGARLVSCPLLFFVQIKLFVVVVIIVLNLNLTNETK